jgi:hypothetical protein
MPTHAKHASVMRLQVAVEHTKVGEAVQVDGWQLGMLAVERWAITSLRLTPAGTACPKAATRHLLHHQIVQLAIGAAVEHRHDVGWLSLAAVRASRRNRSTNEGSCA